MDEDDARQRLEEDYGDEDEDYVVLMGPFEHPTEKLQEELLVEQNFQIPSAPPMFALGLPAVDINPYAHLLNGGEAGEQLCPQNHELFQLLSEYYGSDVKFEAGKTRQTSLQDKIQHLDTVAWEKKIMLVVADASRPSRPLPKQGKQKSNATASTAMTVTKPTTTIEVYAGQTLPLHKRLYNNLFPHQQPFVEPGTFRVAALSSQTCKQKELEKTELLSCVNNTVDCAVATSSTRAAVSNYIAQSLSEYDEMEWKMVCNVLLDHETKQPCALVESHLNQVVDALLLHTDSEGDSLEHQIWLVRRIKRFGWKRQLNACLTQVVDNAHTPAPLEWKQNDWLDRWLILLQVCCEPLPHTTAAGVLGMDVEVLLSLIRTFPLEQGLERILGLGGGEDEQRRRVEQTLRVLTQACMQFRQPAAPFSRELGQIAYRVLCRFSHLENLDDLVLQSCLVLATLNLADKPLPFLGKVSRSTCWRVLATVLNGDFIADEPLAEHWGEGGEEEEVGYRVALARSAIKLSPHTQQEWHAIAPVLRFKFIRCGSGDVATALQFLGTLALQQPQRGKEDNAFANAIAKEFIGLSYLESLVPTDSFANSWVLKLCLNSPALFASCVLPMIRHHQPVFFQQIAELERLLCHESFKWQPVHDADISFLPGWLSVMPKWPQTSPPEFTIALALFLRCDAENLSLEVGNSFASTLALAGIAMETKLGEEAKLQQLLSSMSHSAVMDQLWRVLLGVRQQQQGALSEQIVNAKRHYPNHPMLAFVAGMQCADEILNNLKLLVVPKQRQAIYRAARLLAVRLGEFHPVLIELVRLGGAQEFVQEVVLHRNEDVEFWLDKCDATDYMFAHHLLPHLANPFACNWQVFVKFAPLLDVLPTRLCCQVLMAQTVLQMPAWLLLGRYLQDVADVTGPMQVLEMEHKHLTEVLRLYGGSGVALPSQVDLFAIFGWTDLLLSARFVGFSLDQDVLVSLSVCAQALSSLQLCTPTGAKGELAFGNLFFQFKNIQLPPRITARLQELSKELHMRALHLSMAESRPPVLRLATLCLEMANGSNIDQWSLLCDGGQLDFDRVCIPRFVHVPQALSVVAHSLPPLPIGITTTTAVTTTLTTVVTGNGAVAVVLPNSTLRKRRQADVLNLLKQSVTAVVETRLRLKELAELEHAQFSQLYKQVPCQVPVHDLAAGQIIDMQTVTTSSPDQEMELAWKRTIDVLDGEIEAVVARFAPGSFASTELFSCAHELQSAVDGMAREEDVAEVFTRVFGISFCQDLVQCKGLCEVWMDLCDYVLGRLHCEEQMALYMLTVLVQRHWRIKPLHVLLPVMPTKDLVKAYEVVLLSGGGEEGLQPLSALLLLERLRKTPVAMHDYDLARSLVVDVCFKVFALDEVNAKIVDHLRRHVFRPLLPRLLQHNAGMGLVQVCGLLMNSPRTTPLAGMFWEDVSSVEDSVWDHVSASARSDALLELRPKSTLQDRKMVWNQGFIGLAPLLCRNDQVGMDVVLACWEVWLVAEEDDSLLNAFASCLMRMSTSSNLLQAFSWYARTHRQIPHLEKRFRKLDWSALVVPSIEADGFLRALQSVYFTERVLQPHAPCSAMFQQVVGSASFAFDFKVEECEPGMLAEALSLALRLANECDSVNLLMCLPFERLPADAICLKPPKQPEEERISEQQLGVLVAITLRDLERLARPFLTSLFASGLNLPAQTLHSVLNAFVFAKQWVVPHLVELLAVRGDILLQFCRAGFAPAVEQSSDETTLADRLLPRFLTSREVHPAAIMSTAAKWPVEYDGKLGVGELIHLFLTSEQAAAELACVHALQLQCSGVVNELGKQVDLDGLDLAAHLQEQTCVDAGSGLVLVSGFLKDDVLSRSFQFIRALHYQWAQDSALVLVCAFARSLSNDAFDLDLAQEVVAILHCESKLAADGALCVALAVFGDLIHMFVCQQRGHVFQFLQQFKHCGWACAKLDWLNRGEYGVIDQHSLPWILDQVRFTLFPRNLDNATRLPAWKQLQVQPLTEEGEFLVL
ncbi:hypothetical protein BASA81_011100 [Batrachochytrium salamandrivorans]|nr:hypothetical protein BASA81_011100 [Batrachochytrium salamandrivorans]